MAFDQSHADAVAEAETLRQELDKTKADLTTSEAACASAMAEVEALKGDVRHVVDCYRHDNLMGVIVGVDKLAGLVET